MIYNRIIVDDNSCIPEEDRGGGGQLCEIFSKNVFEMLTARLGME